MQIPQSLRILFGILAMLAAPLAHGQLVITEFLSSNSNSIRDENGNTEDWIEIHNPSASAVNLLGWYLTDNANQPRKWSFPSRTLNPGAYLVVFASSKNRKPASGNLHTNFRLASRPAYLALTHDLPGGGIEAVSAYDYPQQATDISYGSAVNINTTPLVAAAAPVKAFVPTSGVLGSSWRGAAADEPFDDSSWLAGTTGVGFGDSATPVATANLKQRLNADSAATLTADTSGAAHPGNQDRRGLGCFEHGRGEHAKDPHRSDAVCRDARRSGRDARARGFRPGAMHGHLLDALRRHCGHRK